MNSSVRREGFGVRTFSGLMLLGAIFTVGGLFAYQATQIDESWIKVTGEITDVVELNRQGRVAKRYLPVVQYEADNRSYSVTSNTGEPAYPTIGEQREVAYNPQLPDQAKVVQGTNILLLILLFPVIGIGVLGLAPVLFVRSLRRKQFIDTLVESGQKLPGVLVDIASTGSTNRQTTYKITVAATDPTGTVQQYVSDTITGIDGVAITDFRSTPIPIDVYIDPNNPKAYYVDIADIPNLTQPVSSNS